MKKIILLVIALTLILTSIEGFAMRPEGACYIKVIRIIEYYLLNEKIPEKIEDVVCFYLQEKDCYGKINSLKSDSQVISVYMLRWLKDVPCGAP